MLYKNNHVVLLFENLWYHFLWRSPSCFDNLAIIYKCSYVPLDPLYRGLSIVLIIVLAQWLINTLLIMLSITMTHSKSCGTLLWASFIALIKAFSFVLVCIIFWINRICSHKLYTWLYWSDNLWLLCIWVP